MSNLAEMGSGLCKPDQISDEFTDDFKKRNEEIEVEIEKERINDKKIIKMLLLGKEKWF